MKRLRRTAGVGIATAAFVLAAAAPAAQARLTYVQSGATALPTLGQGTASAFCSKKMHAVGGGQYVLSPLFGATLNTSAPLDGVDGDKAPDDGWTSTVRNFSAGDTVNVFVICSDKVPTYVKHRVRTGASPVAKTTRAACPDGTKVMGGGVRLPVTYNDSGWLDSSAPFDGNDANNKPDDGWTAAGGVEERKVDMKVTAICGTGSLKYAAAQHSASPMNYGEAAATCPGTSRVVGGGVTTQGVAFHPMTISSPFDSNADGRPDNGWQGEFDNYSNSDAGLITTFAICKT